MPRTIMVMVAAMVHHPVGTLSIHRHHRRRQPYTVHMHARVAIEIRHTHGPKTKRKNKNPPTTQPTTISQQAPQQQQKTLNTCRHKCKAQVARIRTSGRNHTHTHKHAKNNSNNKNTVLAIKIQTRACSKRKTKQNKNTWTCPHHKTVSTITTATIRILIIQPKWNHKSLFKYNFYSINWLRSVDIVVIGTRKEPAPLTPENGSLTCKCTAEQQFHTWNVA